jgi:hypothetical protein
MSKYETNPKFKCKNDGNDMAVGRVRGCFDHLNFGH